MTEDQKKNLETQLWVRLVFKGAKSKIISIPAHNILSH